MSPPQRVMITAAASGIGRIIAKAFLTAGAKVHICDADETAVAAVREEMPELAARIADVAREADIDAWFDASLDAMGGLDVLVNNAGTPGPIGPVDALGLDEWRACLAVCLDAQFLTARRAAPVMKEQRAGAIINIASTAGLFGYPFRIPYAAAKWAVIGLTKSLAAELGGHGIRVNAICPGSVEGERMERVIAAEAQMRALAPETVRREYLSGQSIRRFVKAQEVADLALFLASPAAAMINGQAIAVDGHTETFHSA